MKKLTILLVIVALMVAVMSVAVAGAAPDAGQGCHCHKMYGQAAVPALAAAHGNSGGKNANAKPFKEFVDCSACHGS